MSGLGESRSAIIGGCVEHGVVEGWNDEHAFRCGWPRIGADRRGQRGEGIVYCWCY